MGRRLSFLESIFGSHAAPPAENVAFAPGAADEGLRNSPLRRPGDCCADPAKTTIKWLDVGKEVSGLVVHRYQFLGCYKY